VFAVLHDARISGVLREGGHAPNLLQKLCLMGGYANVCRSHDFAM